MNSEVSSEMPHHDGEFLPPQQRSRSGCWLVAGIGCAVLVVLFIAACIGIFFWWDDFAVQGYDQVRIELEQSLSAEDRIPELTKALDENRLLLEDGKMSFLTFGLIVDRMGNVSADGDVNDSEVDHVLEILNAAIEGGGKVDLERFAK